MLIRAEKFTDFSNREIWFHSIGVILFDFFLNRCQWNAAESVAQQLLSLSSASSDARIHFDALHRRILLMIYRNQLTSALLSCNDLLEFALHHEWHHQIIVALLTLAEIHQKASSPITAIPYVLRSLSLAERHQYNSLHLTASVLLANLYFQLGDLEDAEDLIETVYLQVQQCSSDALKADIYLLMAKCSIVKLKAAGKTATNITIELLRKSERCYSSMHSIEKMIEVFYLESKILHQMHCNLERNLAARRFRAAIDIKHTNMRSKDIDLYYLNRRLLDDILQRFRSEIQDKIYA